MKKILTALLFASVLIGCKIEPPVPETPTGARIRHKTGKVVSIYEVLSGFGNSGIIGESLILKNYEVFRRDTLGLYDPLIDSQGNIYSRDPYRDRWGNIVGTRVYKNYTPLSQYNRYPEISGSNGKVYSTFLVYDQLYVAAVYDSVLSFCIDGEWYPIETDEGPIDSLASKPWVDNDTIYFLKLTQTVGAYGYYDLLKIPIVNGRPQKGIMAHKEYKIDDSDPNGVRYTTIKRLIVQNDNVLVFTSDRRYPTVGWWYNESQWAVYINGGKMCDNQLNGASTFGGMGVIGNDTYYCIKNYQNKTATIYKNNEVYQTLENVYNIMQSASCGDDMYLMILRKDADGTFHKAMWHNGVVQECNYYFWGALNNYDVGSYYLVPQISYETYVEE